MNENSTMVDVASVCNLVIDQGATVEFVMEFHDDAGAPLSLVGKVIKMDVKSMQDLDAVPIISLSLASGLYVSSNKLIISISSAQTATLIGSEYYYDVLFMTDSKYMVRGKIGVNKSVTR